MSSYLCLKKERQTLTDEFATPPRPQDFSKQEAKEHREQYREQQRERNEQASDATSGPDTCVRAGTYDAVKVTDAAPPLLTPRLEQERSQNFQEQNPTLYAAVHKIHGH